MKRFSFKLEPLLRIRKQKENDVLKKLAMRRREYLHEVQVKVNMQKALADSLQRREDIGTRVADVAQMQIEDLFITGTKLRLIQQDQVIFKANKRVDQATEEYFRARAERKMIDRLKEKAQDRHSDEVALHEAKQLDDQNIMRARFRKDFLKT